jgi:hypothetical protein
MAQKDLYDGMEGISTKLLLLLGYSKEEVTEFLDKARADLMNPEVSCSCLQTVDVILILHVLTDPYVHFHVSI